MMAKILIPVKGAVPDNSKTADNGDHAPAKPSFLLIPALPVAAVSTRASK